MKLPLHTPWIEVFYDGECGMCQAFSEWLEREPKAAQIRIYPYQSREAHLIFPDLPNYHPEREMVIRTWEGEVYQGAEAWVWCLYGCQAYRKLARRLAHPTLLPFASRIGKLVAKNRRGISRLLINASFIKKQKT